MSRPLPPLEAPPAPLDSQLRRMIITGAIAPNSWLREEALAHTFGVSRTPVREACHRVANEGLLEHKPRRGFRAPALDPGELMEIYPILVSLEVLAVQARVEPRDALCAHMSTLNFDTSALPADPGSFYDTDSTWHSRLVAASHNSVLIDMHRRLSLRIARYIHEYWSRPTDLSRSASEHELIVEAISRDNVDLACELMRAHRFQGLERIQQMMAPPSPR